MRNASPKLLSILNSDDIELFWFFRLILADQSEVYRFSDYDFTGNGQFVRGPLNPFIHGYNEEYAWDWAGKVTNHNGIKLNRSRGELRIVAPSDFNLEIANIDNEYSEDLFDDADLTVSIGVGNGTDREIALRFGLKVDTCYQGSSVQTLQVKCKDWLQDYIRDTSYPLTPLVDPLYPSQNQPRVGAEKVEDDYCVPVSWGRPYLNYRSVYFYDTVTPANSKRYYLLGPSSITYTVNRMHTPGDFKTSPVEWLDSSQYDINGQQVDKSDGTDTWTLIAPLVVNNDDDPEGDACPFFLPSGGKKYSDVPLQVDRSDTSTMTAPGDIIRYVLKDIGVPARRISSYYIALANQTYSSWALTWNGGYTFREKSEKILADQLIQCHSRLSVDEIATLEPLTKESVAQLDETYMLNRQVHGMPAYKYTPTEKQKTDSCYVKYHELNKPDELAQKIYGETKQGVHDNPSSDTIESNFLTDAITAQRIGGLYAERKYNQVANINFHGTPKCMLFQPDDVVTNPEEIDYGGPFDMLIDNMHIKPDGTVDINLIRFYTELLSESDMENSVSNGYDTFEDESPTGFRAVKTTAGIKLCGTADEVEFVNGEKYVVAFQATLTSGDAPTVYAAVQINGAGVTADLPYTAVEGQNYWAFTANTTTTGVIEFYNTSNADFTIESFSVQNITGLRDFDDFAPPARTIRTEDDGGNFYEPVVQGNDNTSDTGIPLNRMSKRFWVGDSIAMDGGTDPYISILKETFASTVAGIWQGVESGVAKWHVGGSDSYIKWTGTALDILLAAGEFMTVNGSILVDDGGDIILRADTVASNPAIFFQDSSTTNKITMAAIDVSGTISDLRIIPSSGPLGGVDLNLGLSLNRWDAINVYAYNLLEMQTNNSTNNSTVKLYPTYVEIVATASDLSLMEALLLRNLQT